MSNLRTTYPINTSTAQLSFPIEVARVFRLVFPLSCFFPLISVLLIGLLLDSDLVCSAVVTKSPSHICSRLERVQFAICLVIFPNHLSSCPLLPTAPLSVLFPLSLSLFVSIFLPRANESLPLMQM